MHEPVSKARPGFLPRQLQTSPTPLLLPRRCPQSPSHTRQKRTTSSHVLSQPAKGNARTHACASVTQSNLHHFGPENVFKGMTNLSVSTSMVDDDVCADLDVLSLESLDAFTELRFNTIS